jgi:hypothetical protein
MMKITEPTAQEIKEQRIYAEWGLTDAEYQLIEKDILGGCQIIQKRVYFL